MTWALLSAILSSEQFYGILSLIITTIIGAGAEKFRRTSNIKIEEKYKQDLHDALLSGAKLAITNSPAAGLDYLKNVAISYARKSVPDAINSLVKDKWDTLDDLAISKVAEAASLVGDLTKNVQFLNRSASPRK